MFKVLRRAGGLGRAVDGTEDEFQEANGEASGPRGGEGGVQRGEHDEVQRIQELLHCNGRHDRARPPLSGSERAEREQMFEVSITQIRLCTLTFFRPILDKDHNLQCMHDRDGYDSNIYVSQSRKERGEKPEEGMQGYVR